MIGGNTVLCRSAYAFGYSLVELFKRAQFRIDLGLSPTFEELNRRFSHGHSPGARLSYRRPLLSGRSDGGLLRRQLVVSHYVITLMRRRLRGLNATWAVSSLEGSQLAGTGEEKKTMAKIEEKELEGHREEIIADVKKLVEKYRAIFDWDVPDIDQAAADKLILMEVRRALNELEHKLLG